MFLALPTVATSGRPEAFSLLEKNATKHGGFGMKINEQHNGGASSLRTNEKGMRLQQGSRYSEEKPLEIIYRGTMVVSMAWCDYPWWRVSTPLLECYRRFLGSSLQTATMIQLQRPD